MRQTRFDRCPPITEDDAFIEAALKEAQVPSLMLALVHLTGDLDLIRGRIRPSGDFLSVMGDPQLGISEPDQATVRARALEILKDYRDGRLEMPPPPSPAVVQEMMDFVIGQPVSPDYVEFLMAELSLDGTDPYLQPLEDVPDAAKQQFRVVIIGAGMSGLLAAIRLQEAGIPFVIVEKNADVGGTWYENTYPGCRVDSPNHIYCYSFEPNDWPQHFSRQQILREYFARCADRYGLRPKIRFETEVEEATWDDARKRWTVVARNRDGRRESLEANAVISAVGQLNRPRFPDIPGRDAFAGISFHSARWQHQHDLRGRRVAVIGTGASAFQFVPEIAKQAGEILVFQRTPPWIIKNDNYQADIPAGKHWLLNHVPYYAKWFRFGMFWRTAEGILDMVRVDPEWEGVQSVSAPNEMLRVVLSEGIRTMVGEKEELLAKTIPDYPPAGKRMLIDNGSWIEALKRDNVRVVTEPIRAITPRGVRTDAAEYDADVLIYGTGFEASRFLAPMRITGRNGIDLQESWNGDPRAYLGIAIPGFPNLFCLYGPNTNIVVNGSIVFFSECEVRYIISCIKLLLQQGRAAMDCRREVHDAYNARIDRGNEAMAWGTPGVRSWYKNSKGRVSQNWPFTLLDFWTQTRTPNPSDFELL